MDFIEQRDRLLLQAYNNEMSKKDVRTSQEAISRAVLHPCDRFWVSEYQARNVMSVMIKGKKIDYMSKTKRAMFEEIYKRYKDYIEHNPCTIIDAMFDIVNSPAPQFYITPKRATDIICKIKKDYFKSRMKKLHGLF